MKENGYFQKIRGRKLAKSNNPVKERGKFWDFIEKVKDPEAHIWKEISNVGLNEEQIRNVKKWKTPIVIKLILELEIKSFKLCDNNISSLCLTSLS